MAKKAKNFVEGMIDTIVGKPKKSKKPKNFVEKGIDTFTK